MMPAREVSHEVSSIDNGTVDHMSDYSGGLLFTAGLRQWIVYLCSGYSFGIALITVIAFALLCLQAVQHQAAGRRIPSLPCSPAGGLHPPAEPHTLGCCVQDSSQGMVGSGLVAA
jgi:hypothetical protein